MPQLSDEERWAQICVQRALPQCVVEQNDDGSQQSMYDLRLVYPDGSVGALEVTTAPDAQQTELWQLIGGKGKRWLEPSFQGWLASDRPAIGSGSPAL